MITRLFPILITMLIFYACQPEVHTNNSDFDKEKVTAEVKKTLDEYFTAIKEGGLTAEFSYLDQSDDFYWVPPGFTSALSYDSVQTILEANAPNFTGIEFQWETLRILPLSNELANYTGVLQSKMTDTSGQVNRSRMIESGTLIKRKDGWKLLSGQSRHLE